MRKLNQGGFMGKFLLSFVMFLAFVSSALAVPGFPSKGVNKTVTMTAANNEYSIAIPTGASNISIQSRTAADFKLAFVAGESGTNYYTVKSGTKYEAGTLAFAQISPNTSAFFQSTTAGQVIEVTFWQ